MSSEQTEEHQKAFKEVAKYAARWALGGGALAIASSVLTGFAISTVSPLAGGFAVLAGLACIGCLVIGSCIVVAAVQAQ